MKNPLRKISEAMGFSPDTEISSETDVRELRSVQLISKLWMTSFGGLTALLGYSFIDEGGLPQVSMESDDTVSNITDFSLDVIVSAPVILAGTIAVCGVVEMSRIHRLATNQLAELEENE